MFKGAAFGWLFACTFGELDAGNDFGQPTADKKDQALGALKQEPESTGSLRNRPVYPYPAVARYVGSGDPKNTASYVKGEALYDEPNPPWVGQDFFKPYAASAK